MHRSSVLEQTTFQGFLDGKSFAAFCSHPFIAQHPFCCGVFWQLYFYSHVAVCICSSMALRYPGSTQTMTDSPEHTGHLVHALSSSVIIRPSGKLAATWPQPQVENAKSFTTKTNSVGWAALALARQEP